MTRPFKVESEDVNRLTDIQLTQLLNELLQAEAYKFEIKQRAVEVALNIRVGDGGEDGRISWIEGPDQTDYIPNRLTLFQNKATEMGSADYANEIMTTARKDYPSVLKPKVAEVLDQGGAYIVFTTQELNKLQKDARITAIRNKLEDQNKEYAKTCIIDIYDAAQIAAWTNNFISAIVSVQHWVGRPMERGLKPFNMWSEDEDLSRLPFAAVNSRNDIVATLIKNVSTPKSCFRIIGLSGLGKTRTAFQVFFENEAIRNLVVYVDANHAPTIDALVADWVGLGLRAILVVDNCEYRLHERLVKEVCRTSSQISLLTLDYNMESVSAPTVCFRLTPMTDEELFQLLTPIYKDQLPDLDRITSFAQGFPQMAVLLAQARLTEDPRIGELTEDELANKLLWRRGETESPERIKVLQACSLFDVFGVEREVENQLEFIATVIDIPVDNVYECVQEYSARGLIDRRGRYGQVVPKPLAIRLAGQWWSKTRERKQIDLVDKIPEGMIEGFCHQIERMDFHPDVKQLSEKLCGPQGPFGQAEVILSNRGSRLFRSFVVVNPESTCEALYKILSAKNTQQLHAIDGSIRRNLVWALEKLCFHSGIFSEAAWCMLLLASSENEAYGNNATGIFSQLFSIYLSGTAATPQARFTLLNRALELHQDSVDMVVLEALEQAIRPDGGTRMVGAEYQGTKAPLQEWKPRIWQEIFDYWQEAFDLLISLLVRGDSQKEKVLSTIGHSIRSFVSRGRLEMLDSAIHKIIAVNGRYWPAALESIKHSFEYDTTGLKQEAIESLNNWLKLLSPNEAGLPEKLKILVINPPWEHRKDEEGHYIDVACENAMAFGREVVEDLEALIPHLDLLLQGEQRHSFSFGYQIALSLEDSTHLLKQSFAQLIKSDPANPQFILGIYRGIFKKSQEQWQQNIDKLLEDENLIRLYPDVIGTGEIQKLHLDKLLDLIHRGLIPYNAADKLSYGSVTSDIDPATMMDFCLSLAQFSEDASWTALSVIYMYCFSKSGSIKLLSNQLKQLVSSVPLHRDSRGTTRDTYNWCDLAEKLLKEPDESFAIALTNQLIEACKYGLNHGDILHYTKPLLLNLMREYSNKLWPIFATTISQAKGMELYWLQQLLDRENSLSSQLPSVLSVVPVESVISWCNKQPEVGPSFVASCINIFETVDNNPQPSDLFIALLESFGNDERVQSCLWANMRTRGWSGSLVPYLEDDKAALSPLLEHKNDKVRTWVKAQIGYIDQEISHESVRDEERDLGLF
ncbi:hypothetical protein [Shewanella sp. SM74]|uniref:hypothetical protein n=1 Tax=Shewanella sp. SM74 TaxID=2912807 RepID=UPI0021D8A9DC|nr:hypothetical protein [Shewanella sp. SM74]MCU8011361.1 hypothetical protein [Shewanella sp. SM74]